MELKIVKPVKYAGFWLRFAAVLIDGIFTQIATTLILVPVLIPVIIVRELSDDELDQISFIFTLVFYFIYETILTASKFEGTLGKKIVGIRVTDEAGNRLTLSRSVGRYLAKILSAMIFLIGYLMVGWTKKKTGLHDLIAGTFVVFRNKPVTPAI